MHRRIAALLAVLALSACSSVGDFVGEDDSVSTGTVTISVCAEGTKTSAFTLRIDATKKD